MPIIQDVDIQFVIGRLRPTSEYHWMGSQTTGNTLDEVLGEWRDPNTLPPTEAEIVAEWEVFLAEQAAIEQELATIAGDKSGLRSGVDTRILEIDTDIVALPAATTAETKQIIARILRTQQRILKYLRHL